MNSIYRKMGITTKNDSGSIKFVSREEGIMNLRKSAERVTTGKSEKAGKKKVEADKRP